MTFLIEEHLISIQAPAANKLNIIPIGTKMLLLVSKRKENSAFFKGIVCIMRYIGLKHSILRVHFTFALKSDYNQQQKNLEQRPVKYKMKKKETSSIAQQVLLSY